jgi:organic radical activating enzyme
MRTASYSEIFLSIEGEGMYAGHPTVYLRLVKCNFTCRGFNNPEMKEITNEVLGFDPSEYDSLDKLPVINIGCDSIYSWDNRFKHLWKKRNAKEMADDIMEVVPGGTWCRSNSGEHTIFSLTGGEPTLHQKFLIELLEQPHFNDLKLLLIETNCSVPLRKEFIDFLNQWTEQHDDRLVVWSNSPKLSISGEPWEKAIRPEIAAAQLLVKKSKQYFKFVCSDDDRDFDEVDKAMNEYWKLIEKKFQQVYIMPVGATEEQQDDVQANVALKCMDRGYIFCPRIHVHTFGNVCGT